MKKLWEFYEELNEIVYVADPESCELIYLNRRACELYGIRSAGAVRGKKCYEVLMRSSIPCAVCNRKKLKTGRFAEEVRYNPVIRRKLALKDTLVEENGKHYRFELAVDLSVTEQQNRGYEDSEAMVNEGLRISLAASTPEGSIEALLEYVGQFLSSGRVYLIEQSERNMLDNTYEWCANGVKSQKDCLQNIPLQVVKPWYDKFQKGENIVIKDVEKLRESEPVIYKYLEPQEIHSLVVSPLMNDGKIIGFYGVDNPPEESLLHSMTLLQILGHFIVSLLHRRNHVSRLEELCFHDQLTGIGNRHAMNEYLNTLHPWQSIGVVYCDVMGLKQMNDTKGHREGDRLLVRASECLRETFGNYELFRVGGDEFLALCVGITEEELVDRMKLLKRRMQERNSLMALGSAFCRDGRCDPEQLIKDADSRMYEEKRAWYDAMQYRQRHREYSQNGEREKCRKKCDLCLES